MGINLRTRLGFRTSFAFPLQSSEARRDVLVGGLLLLLPGVGWILNLGHRVVVVHRLLHEQEPWPAWRPVGSLLKHGGITFLGMLLAYFPAFLLAGLAWPFAGARDLLRVAAAILFVAATLAIPGFMTHYCVAFDTREILRPTRALRRSLRTGVAYWKAWGIAIGALACSLLGLLGLGVGFLLTSVWFWQVAGFAFATAFAGQFALGRDPSVTATPRRPPL